MIVPLILVALAVASSAQRKTGQAWKRIALAAVDLGAPRGTVQYLSIVRQVDGERPADDRRWVIDQIETIVSLAGSGARTWGDVFVSRHDPQAMFEGSTAEISGMLGVFRAAAKRGARRSPDLANAAVSTDRYPGRVAMEAGL